MADDLKDQAVALDKRIWEYELSEVDIAIEKAIEDKDDHWIRDLMGTKVSTIRIQGVAMSMLLAGWRRYSGEFGIADRDWIDHASAWTGLAASTIYKYIDVWQNVLAPWVNTERFWMLVAKPMPSLLLLPAAAKEGQLDEGDWQEIEQAEDGLAVRDVVKRVRGEQTSSKTAIQLVVARDGTISAWRQDEVTSVGYLDLDEHDPLVSAAVGRILNAAGIRRE